MRDTYGKRILPLVLLCGILLISQTALAIDTGRRCCVAGMDRPEDDWGETLRPMGAVYLKEKGQVFVVDDLGYVGFFDTVPDSCP